MSAQAFKLDPPPIRVQPIVKSGPQEGLYTPQWETWFTSVWRLLKVITTALPINVRFGGAYAGGGTPFDLAGSITVPSPATLYISISILQSWVTAQPTWQVQIKVDGTVIFDSGAAIAQWQQLVAANGQLAVAAGVHSIDLIWINSTANGTLTQADLVVVPVITT